MNIMLQNRKSVTAMTEAAVEAYNLPEEAIVVLIKENAPENVGVGGKLVIDRRKEWSTIL